MVCSLGVCVTDNGGACWLYDPAGACPAPASCRGGVCTDQPSFCACTPSEGCLDGACVNINEDNPAYAVFVRPTAPGAIRWIDAYRTVHPERRPDEASFNGFKPVVDGSRIDFIFHTADFAATAAAIDRTSRDGRYPSDHYPVTAVLEWRK